MGGPPDINYGTNNTPKEFNILGRGGAGTWTTSDLVSEDSSNALSSAVMQRTVAVEARYNVKVKANLYTQDIPKYVEALSMSDDNEFDLFNIVASHWGKLVLKGYFQDLRAIDVFDFEDDWWNQRFVNNLTLYNQLYGIIETQHI